jgi:hypothetical protein
MAITKKILLGGINSDDVEHIIDTKDYLNALNMRFITNENGKAGKMTDVEGTVMKNALFNGSTTIPFVLPTGTNTTIGVVEDPRRNRVIFFNKNSNNNNGIYCYDYLANVVYKVVDYSQVVGGLEFGSDIHSCAIMGDVVYWTDGDTPQKKINIEAGIKGNHPSYVSDYAAYTFPMAASVLGLVRNQPAYPLLASKSNDAAYLNNFIKNEAFQFCYRFVYRDFEVSTFSPLSILLNYNLSESNLNRIEINIPTAQKIQQDVIRIEIAVKYVYGNKYSIVKVWDYLKDATAIANHNSGTATALRYYFYNDTIGVSVDDATATKPFDSIPLLSETLEIAKDRLFLGNNTDGYASPSTTSLSNSLNTTSGTTPTGQWYQIQYYKISDPTAYYAYVLKITNILAEGYYIPSIGGPFENTPLPTSVDFTTYIRIATDEDSLRNYVDGGLGGIKATAVISLTPDTATITNAPSSSGLVGKTVFKSDSYYKLGVVFYDEAGRKCGVVTNDTASTKAVIPDRNYASIAYTESVNWALSNASSAIEIPDWARYYGIVMTKCLRTNFFMQARADYVGYISKDSTTGEFEAPVTSYSATAYGIVVQAKSLNSFGIGYAYQAGDILKLYKSGVTTAPLSLAVKGTYSDYVIVELKDIGLTGSTNYFYELYTPYTLSFNEYYYETGNTYLVNNPGTPSRSYSSLTGTITGDVTILQRNTSYLVEAMSPNDTYWKNWITNAGRVNIVNAGKQTKKRTSVYFSDVRILGTESNGLSSFDALNQYELPYELSAVRKLQLVNKVETEGTLMLAIGENETAVMYLGETQVFDNTGSSFLAKSSGVIGNVNVLRGSYGTINPESVCRFAGSVYWFDANKGCMVAFNESGLNNISDMKMFNHWKKVGQDILANGKKIYGGIDPYNGEVLMYAPYKSVIPVGIILSDTIVSSTNHSYSAGSGSITLTLTSDCTYTISSTNNVTITYAGETITNAGSSGVFVARTGINNISVTAAASGTITLNLIQESIYDTYNALDATWGYSIANNRWETKYSFKPDWMNMVGNRLISFYNGIPYVHNGPINNFYGRVYDSAVAIVHSEGGNSIKVYKYLSVEGDTPDYVHIRTEIPYVQSTDILKDEFVIREGVNYAAIKRDRLSPNDTGTYDSKMFTGDQMRGEVAKIMIVYKAPTTKKSIKFIDIDFDLSIGQTV